MSINKISICWQTEKQWKKIFFSQQRTFIIMTPTQKYDINKFKFK